MALARNACGQRLSRCSTLRPDIPAQVSGAIAEEVAPSGSARASARLNG